MIRSGVTSFADLYYFESDVAQATADAGMRAMCAQTVLKFPSPDAPSYEDGLARTRQFIEKWKGHPLIVPAVGPHAPYTCTDDILTACADLALEFDVPLHIHIAETRLEVDDSRTEFPAAHSQLMNQRGVEPWDVGVETPTRLAYQAPDFCLGSASRLFAEGFLLGVMQ